MYLPLTGIDIVGGVAIDGRDDVPEGKANLADKLIGKTQKVSMAGGPSQKSRPILGQVAGKMTKNPEMHEKGELREAGGKGAVTGEARAPHD